MSKKKGIFTDFKLSEKEEGERIHCHIDYNSIISKGEEKVVFTIEDDCRLIVKKEDTKEVGSLNFLESEITVIRGILGEFVHSYQDNILTLRDSIEGHSFFSNIPLEDKSQTEIYLMNTYNLIADMKKIYSLHRNINATLTVLDDLIKYSYNKSYYNDLNLFNIIVQILNNKTSDEICILHSPESTVIFLDNQFKKIIESNKLNNKKTDPLENKKANTNNLDPLKTKLDDPQHSRAGRDFKSAQSRKVLSADVIKPKVEPKPRAKYQFNDKQKRQTFRTFEQVIEAITEACLLSDEAQNEFIVACIIYRLKDEFPEIYEKLKAKKDEFPKIRSDARPGIDFLYEEFPKIS